MEVSDAAAAATNRQQFSMERGCGEAQLSKAMRRLC
jgi:hypothetical protein